MSILQLLVLLHAAMGALTLHTAQCVHTYMHMRDLYMLWYKINSVLGTQSYICVN